MRAMTIEMRKAEHIDKAAMESEKLLVEIVPDDGGRLSRLYDKSHDCELIWSNPRTADTRRYYNCNYDDLSASGIEEAFPTVQPCTVGDANLPFFGEIWTLPWQSKMIEDDAGAGILLSCMSPVYPAKISKAYRIDDEYTLTADYCIENIGTLPFKYIFGVHPSLHIYPGSCLYCPEGEYEIYTAFPQQEMVGRRFSWPVCKEIDFSKALSKDSKSYFSFVGMPAAGAVYGVTHPKKGTGLQISFDHKYFRCISLWPLYGMPRGLHCIMTEVFTAWPAALHEAIKNGGAYTLNAGESVSTRVTYTVTPAGN